MKVYDLTFLIEKAKGTDPGFIVHAYDNHTEDHFDFFSFSAMKPLGEQLIALAEWAIGLDDLI
ncbi:MAG: hypothetical protein JRC93_03940 [Deltaproteobacteria bacterium]|nr:hypothetical protein [Deltaproteobacteria bacterium]